MIRVEADGAADAAPVELRPSRFYVLSGAGSECLGEVGTDQSGSCHVVSCFTVLGAVKVPNGGAWRQISRY
ncbi:MAG: hypothetical protein KJP19_10865 [Deltaproteobacteria bacterium]|nr:hypothetical protein [Deltaproteobacteria bacterium]